MTARRKLGDDRITCVLTKCRRRCALCFGLENDDRPKIQGQIAHIDRDHSNDDEGNLAYLCIPHHDQYDTTPRQSKGLTPGEVKHYRDALYAHLGTDKTPARIASPDSKNDEWSALALLGGRERVCKALVSAISQARVKAGLTYSEIERITGVPKGDLQKIVIEPMALSSGIALSLMAMLNIGLHDVFPFPSVTDAKLQAWRVYLRNMQFAAAYSAGDPQKLMGDAALVLIIYSQALRELDSSGAKGGKFA